ncbi:putative membrane protein [Granulicella rosea]|uniref:Putative membrane protein n=1 Tax=Granulicella rosea TaxID=474952 RepID=A0A239H4P3_9BACT|nr:phage holin family protein [Granulicella rosea]SNS76347.1 putative membrane protein [Granulicella rosea]
MVRVLLHWVLNAIALLVVSHFVAGFVVSNFVSALIAVLVIGLLNATFGLMLKLITLPLGIVTFGLFFLVINAIILKFSSVFVPGFSVMTFAAAFWGAVALGVIHVLIGLFRDSKPTPVRD